METKLNAAARVAEVKAARPKPTPEELAKREKERKRTERSIERIKREGYGVNKPGQDKWKRMKNDASTVQASTDAAWEALDAVPHADLSKIPSPNDLKKGMRGGLPVHGRLGMQALHNLEKAGVEIEAIDGEGHDRLVIYYRIK